MSRFSDIILPAIIILLSLGLIMVYSASSSPFSNNISGLTIFIKQFKWVLIGFLFLFICSFMNHKKLRDFANLLYLLSIILALVAFATKNPNASTARWLTLFGTNIFQTSEFIKLSLIIFTASFIAKNKRKIHDFDFMIKRFYPFLLLPLIVILLQPDLSTTLIIGVIIFAMLFAAGIDKKQIKVLSGLLIASLIFKFLFMPGLSGKNNYQNIRLQSYLNGNAIQQDNAVDSIIDGGVFGVGLGDSMWKGDHVPEAQTDFIYSVVISEIGLFGLLIVTICFFIIFIRGINVVKDSRDLFGMFLAMGITFNVFFYYLVHVGYNIGILPTTGLPLPFVSYGGSHTLFNLSQVGLLLSISNRINNE